MKFFLTILIVSVIGGGWIVLWPPYARSSCAAQSLKAAQTAAAENKIPEDHIKAAEATDARFSVVADYANYLYLECVKKKGITQAIDSHVPFDPYTADF